MSRILQSYPVPRIFFLSPLLNFPKLKHSQGGPATKRALLFFPDCWAIVNSSVKLKTRYSYNSVFIYNRTVEKSLTKRNLKCSKAYTCKAQFLRKPVDQVYNKFEKKTPVAEISVTEVCMAWIRLTGHNNLKIHFWCQNHWLWLLLTLHNPNKYNFIRPW